MSNCVTPETAAHQAPPSLGFSRQATGVACHFLLQCMKVKSESEVAQVVYLKVIQLCPTPSDPMDCSLLGSSVHGIFQARVLEWGASAFSNSELYGFKYEIIPSFSYLHCISSLKVYPSTWLEALVI